MIESGSRECSSSVRIRVRGRKGSNLSKFSSVIGAFLRRREFRSRLKNNSASVDFTAHLDRSIANFLFFSLSLSLSVLSSFFFRRTNQRQRSLYLFSIRSTIWQVSSDFVCSTILESRRASDFDERIGSTAWRFRLLFFFFYPFFKQACDTCMIFVYPVNLYIGVVVSPRIFLFPRNS